MEIGAVIVAAGMSSRMGDFKPMLNIGPLSVAQHVINAFQQAGVTKIAVVTGHNASALKEHLSPFGVTFLHNEHYECTQMFDSALIGLSYMKGHCDRILFTPIDIPLFTSLTIKKLIESGAELAAPICSGKQGHPLMLSPSVIETILSDSGEGGLKGSITRSGIPMTHIEVNDPGVLRDADTPEEFQQLLALYRNRIEFPLYPTDPDIEQLLNEAKTPEHIRAHCSAVANKAIQLAEQLNDPVDLGLLRAACLLHDIDRANSKNHAVAAAELLNQKGYSVLSEIVGQHHDLPQNARIEAKLLYLADKLIQGSREVTLHERFMASKEKCTTLEAIQIWELRYRNALEIAQYCQPGGTI